MSTSVMYLMRNQNHRRRNVHHLARAVNHNCPEITPLVKHGKHDVPLQKIDKKKQQHKDERLTTVVKNTQSRNCDV